MHSRPDGLGVALLGKCMEKKKNLILIDGHALAFRQYFALERTGMRTSTGVPSWAVFGFFKALFDLMKNKELEPDAIAVTFDVSHHTFRTERYDEYKANREKMPDDLHVQMGLIYEGLQAFSIPIYQKEGFEADDVIGTISKKACELGHKVYILTGDQDSFQLVDTEGCVKVIIPSKGELVEYDWDKVYEKLGVYPNQVIDYKALRGDSSDNIPGIRGIGEKTAQKLLGTYGDLGTVYENVDNIKEKAVREKLKNGKDMAYMSQFLATIVRDVDVDFDFDKACINLPMINSVTAFLTKMQFFSFLKNIKNILATFNREGACAQNSENNTQLGLFAAEEEPEKTVAQKNIIEKEVMTVEDFNTMSDMIHQKGAFFFTTSETVDSLLKQKINYIALGVADIRIDADKRIELTIDDEHQAFVYYIPLNLRYNLSFGSSGALMARFKALFEDENLAKLTVDSKKEYNALRSNGIMLDNVVFDAVLASYVENPSNNHDMDVQALQCLNISPIKEMNVNARSVQLGLLEDGADSVKAYREIWLLMELTKYRVESFDNANWKLLQQMEIPLAKVLAEMEYTGVSINISSLNELTEFLNKKIRRLERCIFDIADEGFNLNSPKQVGEILFDKLGIQHKKKARGRSTYSTSAEVLEELAEEHDIAKYLLQYRKYSKLKSTYTDALPNLINPIDKRIHTTYNQTITATGRLSSSNPNLQNIPTRTDEGEKIREAFVPENPDNLIVSADYSQIELRLLAHISDDKNLQQAFIFDKDVHAITASNIFEVPLSQVTKQMRARAKTVNFGIIYGQTRYGLGKAIGITPEEAEEFINRYFATYSGIKLYMNAMIERVMIDGYAETIFGRRRFFQNEISSSNAMVREFAKRAAINFPMQGSASDLMKLAMIRFRNSLLENNLKSKLIMQVHDEMVVEVEREELDIVKKLVREAMELDQPLSVPLIVNIKEGSTW